MHLYHGLNNIGITKLADHHIRIALGVGIVFVCCLLIWSFGSHYFFGGLIECLLWNIVILLLKKYSTVKLFPNLDGAWLPFSVLFHQVERLLGQKL